MVVRDIILVVAVLGVMVFGFFVMKRLDKFLDENRKRIEQEKKEKEWEVSPTQLPKGG